MSRLIKLDPLEPNYYLLRANSLLVNGMLDQCDFFLKAGALLDMTQQTKFQYVQLQQRLDQRRQISSQIPPIVSVSSVSFETDLMWATLSDGRVMGVPLNWFPRLLEATPEQRDAVEITPFGLHWAELDEDISVPALLDGKRANTAA